MSLFDPADDQRVLEEIGPQFATAISTSVRTARDKYRGLRAREPHITRLFTQRTSANVLHDLIWSELAASLGDNPDYSLVDTYPLRMITHPCGSRLYRIRIKRHRGNFISSYATATDKKYYSGNVDTFDGYEVVSLAAGYRWDSEIGEVICPVISYRQGKDNVVWQVEPSDGTETGTSILKPAFPEPPLIDLFDELEADETDIAEGDGQ